MEWVTLVWGNDVLLTLLKTNGSQCILHTTFCVVCNGHILLYHFFVRSLVGWHCCCSIRIFTYLYKSFRCRCHVLVMVSWWGAGVVICLERGADLHMAQLMPLPLTVSCFCKIQIGFTLLVPAHTGSPGKRAIKWACVSMC